MSRIRPYLVVFANPLVAFLSLVNLVAVGLLIVQTLDRSAYAATVPAVPGEVSGVIRTLQVSSTTGSEPTVSVVLKREDGTYVSTSFEGENARAILLGYDRGRAIRLKAKVGPDGVVESLDFKAS